MCFFSFSSLNKIIYNLFHDKRVRKSRIFIQMCESILSILASKSVTFNLLPRFVLINHLHQKALIYNIVYLHIHFFCARSHLNPKQHDVPLILQ